MIELLQHFASEEYTDYVSALNQGPNFARKPDGTIGLEKGIQSFHIPKDTQSFDTSTAYRIVCDACLVLVFNEDGSTDGTISHFLPKTGSRLAHAQLIRERVTPYLNKAKSTYVLLLTAFPFWISGNAEKEAFGYLTQTLKEVNGGIDPNIVSVNQLDVSENSLSDISLHVRKEPDGLVQTVRVGNPNFERSF